MAITDKKIGSWTNPVVNEADQPQRTAAEMKAIFDANSNQIKAAFNAVIDEIVGTGGAGNVGNGAFGEIPAGTVAAQLAALLNMFGSYPSSSDIKGIRLSADNKIEVTLDGTTWQPTVQTGDPVTDLGALPVAADIQDTDGFLMYDASEMKNKRTLWSKIKSVLGNAFAEAGHTHTPSNIGAASSDHTHTLSSLGAAAAPQTKELFLDTSGWESFGLTRWETVPGVTDESIIIITPAPASLKLWAEAGVRCIASNNGQLKFACDTVPADSVTANILIVG